MADAALVSINADLTQLRRSLADIPNMTSKELQRTLIAVEKTVKRAEAQSKMAVKSVADASKKATSEAQRAAQELDKANKEGLKGLAEFAGIDVGPIEKLGEASKLLSTTGGALLGVGGGIALMFAGVAASVYSLVTSAIELNDTMQRLDELSDEVSFPPEYAQNVANASDSLLILKGSTDILVYTLGAELAPYLTWVVNGLIEMIKWAGESGSVFSQLGSILKTVASVYLQNMIDVMTFGVQRFLDIIGLTGKLATALGASELGASLSSASSEAQKFISTLGGKVVDSAIENTTIGLGLIKTEANLGAQANAQLANSLRLAGEESKGSSESHNAHAQSIKKISDEAMRARESLLDMATTSEIDKLWRDLEKTLSKIDELESLSGDSSLAESARVQAFQKYAQGALKYNEELESAQKDRVKSLQEEANMWNSMISSLEDFSQEFTFPTTFVEGVKSAMGALGGLSSSIKGALGEAVASGTKSGFDMSSMFSVSGLIGLAGDAVSSGKDAEKFGAGLAKQAGHFVNAIVEALPGLIDGLIGELPYLFSKISAAIPELVETLAEAIPRIVFALISALPELIIAIIASLPKIIIGLVKGFAKAIPDFIKYTVEIVREAFSRVKQFIKDVFKEAITLGRADTKTFGDTPGPVIAGAGGLIATFAPGDKVIAAKGEQGLRNQLGMNAPQNNVGPVYATLDIRDGLIPFDKILKRNIRSGGVLAPSHSGRRR